MTLSDREKDLIKAHIDRGEPLPPKYKLALFADAPEVELIWQGKTSEVTSVVLPFQSIEQIDEPRKEAPKTGETGMLGFSIDAATGRQAAGAAGGWSNKLIWGDNKLVLSSLKNGPMRRAIEEAGGLKLVYIDPPFDVGADFSFNIDIGEEVLTKEPSLIEELAYRDTWGRGTDSYLAMIHERLKLIRELLAPAGNLYVHLGWQVAPYVKVLLDELFGADWFLNEIIRVKCNPKNYTASAFGNIHDTILSFARGETYVWNKVLAPVAREQLADDFPQVEDGTGYRYTTVPLHAPGIRKGETGEPWRSLPPPKGRHWAFVRSALDKFEQEQRIEWSSSGNPRLKMYAHECDGYPIQDIWTEFKDVRQATYVTEKPEQLLERIVTASSNPGDLVADFFCGSGTTLAVAEKLGRKWIGCDLGRFAIHTTRKRLIGVQRQLKAEDKPYRAFEILNLGKYERQYFVGIDPTAPEAQRREETLRREEHYLGLILTAYKAERAFQSPPFHGKKNGAMIVVGPIDAPVTQSQVAEAVAAAARMRIGKVDCLGFEFEMGLAPHAQDEAKVKGVALSLKYIPKDVFDKRAVEKGQVKFYDVAYVEIKPHVKNGKVSVELTDFGVFYQQDATDEIAEELKPGGSRVTVEAGQVVKVIKDKQGIVNRERLTRKWTDWIDYWAVDFDYESRQEFVRIVEPAPPAASEAGAYRETLTGGYIFENEWQSFRTRKDRSLELRSVEREYPRKGKYKVAVKVIDIFGNDTTKVVEVKV